MRKAGRGSVDGGFRQKNKGNLLGGKDDVTDLCSLLFITGQL